MQTVIVVTDVAAGPARCFDLARDIDLHVRSMAHTGERAVAGVTSGLIGAGQRVTWQARHFGVTQRFTSQITAFDPPHYFQDSMVRGAFASFVHDHHFAPQGTGTIMRDTLRFQSPLGPVLSRIGSSSAGTSNACFQSGRWPSSTRRRHDAMQIAQGKRLKKFR